MTRLLLVRHGQSEWNALGRWQGHADPPLSDLGREQARRAADAVGSVDLIGASTLQRAHETARILSEHVGVGPVFGVPGLVERAAGEWTGLTKAEIEARWPGAIEAWRLPDGMEGDDALWTRVETTLVALGEELDGAEALIVTHGGVISTLVARLGHGQGRISNLSGVVVEVRRTAVHMVDRVELVDPDATSAPLVEER